MLKALSEELSMSGTGIVSGKTGEHGPACEFCRNEFKRRTPAHESSLVTHLGPLNYWLGDLTHPLPAHCGCCVISPTAQPVQPSHACAAEIVRIRRSPAS